MQDKDAEPSVVAEPLTVQEEDLVLPDESQPTDIPPKIDKLGPKPGVETPEEKYEEGLLREFDLAFAKWLKRRGWTKGIPPKAGEDPEFDSMQAHYNHLRLEGQKRASVRRKFRDYRAAKLKEKHDAGTNIQEVSGDIPGQGQAHDGDVHVLGAGGS